MYLIVERKILVFLVCWKLHFFYFEIGIMAQNRKATFYLNWIRRQCETEAQ